jgi:hypothetical protein
MEARLGADFSDVRIHDGSAASVSAAEIGARAYTVGNHVVIGDGGGDKNTLAHELTHVIQQRQGPVSGTDHGNGLSISDPGDRYEREAEANARRVMARQPAAQQAGEAGQKPVTPEPGTSGRVPLQRAKLNLRPNDTTKHQAGTISGISGWAGRPASNLSHQGQHRTAFVVFENAVENRVLNCTPAEAANNLIALLDEYLALPGMKQKNARYLEDHFAACAADLKDAAAMNDAKEAAQKVGEQIDRILAIRNQVPGTAEQGTGGGHGEANSSGIVQAFEEARRAGVPWRQEWGDEKTVGGQMCQMLWRLLDYDPSSPDGDAKRQEKIQTVILTHYQSVRSAYPEVWDWLTDKGYYLADYILDHRQDVGMPLTKLSDAELEEAIKFVHDRL